MNQVRTRIAPSPTGFPHIGTIYSILFDYAYAKNHKGHFIIRIEDTDRQRFVETAEEKLYEAVDWFGLTEDESPRKGGPFEPYRQSERLAIYKKYAQDLIEQGHAYYCFCSKERLDQLRDQQQKAGKIPMYDNHCRNLSKEEVEKKRSDQASYVIRMKISHNTKIRVHDQIRGDIEFDSDMIDDQVLIKADGFPTYHLAAIVDDHLMNITDVVRGEEWLPSFPKHILLYQYFGWEPPHFYHTAALRNPDHSKLSKRHGNTSIGWYQEEGFLPEAILNFLALLGWSHPEEKEIFSLEEFIRLFDLKDIKPAGPIFDLKKLEWINGEYLRMMAVDQLKQKLYEYDPTVQKMILTGFGKENENLIIGLAQTRMKTLKDFKELITQPQNPVREYSAQEKELAPTLKMYMEKLDSKTWGDKDKMLEALKQYTKENKTSMKTVYFLLTRKEQGLPLLEQIVDVYQKEILNNIHV